jgi:N-acyl-D-amino-acid deacylase
VSAQADLVLRGASVLDGSGTPAFEADVEIRGDTIERVGRARAGRREIDASGLVLAPGFVDTHTHDDGALLDTPGMEFKLAQGCTTLVLGNCGFSAHPREPGAAEPPAGAGLFRGLGAEWSDLAGYAAAVAARQPALNAISLVGHNTLRALAVGNEERAPSEAELARMRAEVERALEQGACGLSTGLIYRPGRWSTTEEVIEIARPLRAYGALYATHLRDEGDRLLDAVDEALRIGRAAGCGVHLSHHKASGRRNWGRVRDSLAKVDAANAAGADVTLDAYPYTAGSGPMVEYFRLDRIDPELAAAIQIATCPAFPGYEGRRATEIAAGEGIPPTELIRRILTAPKGERTLCIQFTMDEADVETNLRHPRMMIGSDGIPDLAGHPHPRLFGTFPRVLAHYVRERALLPLAEAVRRMTSLACERFGLERRGRVREGWFADLVLFDAAAIRDTATYERPKQEPEGIACVIVNGAVAYDHGLHTGVGAGRMLRYRKE